MNITENFLLFPSERIWRDVGRKEKAKWAPWDGAFLFPEDVPRSNRGQE